jgi:tight adherence protein C
MVFTCFIFFAVFVLFASAGQFLFCREATPSNTLAAKPSFGKKRTLSSYSQQYISSLANLIGSLDRILPRSKKDTSLVQRRLVRAGYRNEFAVRIFYGAKFLGIVIFLGIVFVTGLWRVHTFFVILLALVVGFAAPDVWLSRKVTLRQKRIRLGLPDVLDLLIVCVEAGLSLDQATYRTADELTKSQPEISDELGVVILEQRAGRHRTDAWKGFAERTNVPSVRNVVSMLVQSEQLGTSIGKTLRVHSETLRTQRIQQVEEQAAKTSIKMLFPLVLLIFPSIFLVSLGPAIIQMLEMLNKK